MNADKLPDVPDDPVPAAETPRLTDSPQPEKVPRPSPEAEHPSPPDRRQPPDREPEPERESHDEQREPESEHRPESPAPANESDTPAPTDSPSHLTPNTPDTADTSESRSRQEHADYHPSPDAAPQPLDPVERADQEEAPPAKATPSEKEKLVASDDLPANPHNHPPGESEVSSVQEELPDEAGTKPDRDKEYGGAPPQEDPPDEPPDTEATGESTPREETDQRNIGDTDETPDKADAPSSGPMDQEVSKPNNYVEQVDDRNRPLTVREHTERITDVQDRLAKAHTADLASDHQHTTDPDRQQWTAERDRIHGEIVRDIYGEAFAVPCEYIAIIAGGLGGAGKSTVLSAQVGIEQSQYLTINPDEIKEEMARRGLVPTIEGLSPMEASDLVHEESSAIAKQLAHRAQLDGKNLIWDITMSSQESTQERIDDLRSAGYSRIDAIFVDIPIETSIRRTQARHHEGHDKWRAGEGLGGRFVPPEVILRQADSGWGSKNRRTFEATKVTVDNWIVLDNSVDGRRAVVVESSKPRSVGQKEDEEGAR